LKVFNFLLIIFGSSFSFFGVGGGWRGLCSCEFWTFFVLLFWSFQFLRVFCFTILKFQTFQTFFLSFCGSLKKFVWSFEGGKGLFAFLLVNFESFLFLYFEISESLIFFLSFWRSSFSLCEVSQGQRWGICFSSSELCKFFVLVFWSSRNFNFLLVILGSSIFCVKFHKQENEMCAFLLVNFEGFCFGILKFQSLQFASCHFGGFTWGEIMLGILF